MKPKKDICPVSEAYVSPVSFFSEVRDLTGKRANLAVSAAFTALFLMQ